MTKRSKNANATLFFSLASGSVGTSQRGQAVLLEDENDLQRSIPITKGSSKSAKAENIGWS